MRHVKIMEDGFFETVDKSQKLDCPFQEKKNCSINCAACDSAGAYVYCVINGEEKKFQIGWISK